MASCFARMLRILSSLTLAALIATGTVAEALAGQAATPAREIFGRAPLPTTGAPKSYGFYSKGCLAGGVAIPTDGPTWQAMRLSRNRRWGHPQMIALIERLSNDAAQYDGWPGLLLGDISQPRGGPMLNGHASHQIGLDADIWLTPMPPRTLSSSEREELPFTSMLQKGKFLKIDPNRWTQAHARLIMRAASYTEVERVFVNPAIKKKLCDSWNGDRRFLGKVRPIYGHDSHFHIRIGCPEGAAGCKGQAAVPAGDGCDKSLAYWFTAAPWAKPKPGAKPVKPRLATLADLPKSCVAVLGGPAPASEMQATYGYSGATIAAAPAAAGDSVTTIEAHSYVNLPANVPIPLIRPSTN
ncbi:penicillin-insensitive murein endopeptidase [Rhizobiaceae bacterium n13]|uniref:Penicillin-insensitive murein endopeptidase n=1 Tax=Ferirhizobium litorale TaxID=2927786 RepID=A0AAE3QF57_9HYPH|nr:penicillin-insensitive murein endopeptidase [Fererhizobium litorale]MDI7862909.1 penicillin-insensitive murein endopeptidase [Fererhizobium litorale]MDI7923995.1 penicillin-insensitive murein endopeptidase [Fererhizobium litorale]